MFIFFFVLRDSLQMEIARISRDSLETKISSRTCKRETLFEFQFLSFKGKNVYCILMSPLLSKWQVANSKFSAICQKLWKLSGTQQRFRVLLCNYEKPKLIVHRQTWLTPIVISWQRFHLKTYLATPRNHGVNFFFVGD